MSLKKLEIDISKSGINKDINASLKFSSTTDKTVVMTLVDTSDKNKKVK